MGSYLDTFAAHRLARRQVGDPLPLFSGASNEGLVSLQDVVEGMWSVVYSVPGPFDAVSTTVRCCDCRGARLLRCRVLWRRVIHKQRNRTSCRVVAAWCELPGYRS